MPGKVPPELMNTKLANKSPNAEKPRKRISSNLIDLDTPIDHQYVNEKDHDESVVFEDLITSKLKI